MWDTLKLEWAIGLQRLPFFTQRFAVALLGLLVVSLALVGAMMILWGGPQSSELPLRPPPEAQHPAGPPTGSGPQPPGAPREQAGAAVPASARSTASVTSGSGSGPSSSSTSSTARRSRAAAGSATAAGSTTTTTLAPTTTRDDQPELTVPPVLTSLLR